MDFNNIKLSIQAMMPNNVNDVILSVTPLQYIDVVIDNVKFQGLCDSDAQIPMINKRLVERNAGSLGISAGSGHFLDIVQAELVLLLKRRWQIIDENRPTQIIFAVTDCMTWCDIILPSTISDELRTAKSCSVMLIPNANCIGVNKSPDVCDSDEPQTDEQTVQSVASSYDKGDDLSSLDIAMLGDKTVSHPTVSMIKVDVIKITKSDLADEQSKDLL